jgi:hypothetical protein
MRLLLLDIVVAEIVCFSAERTVYRVMMHAAAYSMQPQVRLWKAIDWYMTEQ